MQSFGTENHTKRTIWRYWNRDNESLGWVNLAQSKHTWEAVLNTLLNFNSIQIHALTNYNIQQNAYLKPQYVLKSSAFCWVLYFT